MLLQLFEKSIQYYPEILLITKNELHNYNEIFE